MTQTKNRQGPPALPPQEMIALTELQKHPKNYKNHPPVQINNIVASLKEHGQRKPVPVRKTPEGIFIIAGHGVVKSLGVLARENLAKWGYCWVTYVPDDWSDEHAIAYLIADNKTGEGAEDDKVQLLDLLGKTRDAGFSLAQVGFTQKTFEMLVSETAKPEKIRPEVPFSEELLESQNYVVLVFHNDVDWLHLQSQYPLPQVKAFNDKPGYDRVGVGRVLDGMDFLRKVKGIEDGT